MRIMTTALAATALLAATYSSGYAEDTAPTEIAVSKTGAGWQITDAKGMTAYIYDRDNDAPGKSVCNAQCAKAWPPIAAPADAKTSGDWTVIARDDGSKQWAYRGKPLYTYAKDAYPGAIVGEGVQAVWHTAFQPIDTPAGLGVSDALIGRVLVDARGMTLYTREGETAKSKPACAEKCLQNWTPVSAAGMANTIGEFAAAARSDGSRQWTYQGKPLYAFRGDIRPGDANGNNVEKAWHAVVLKEPLPMPSWVTTQNTDMGAVFADAKGMTIYAFVGNMEKVHIMTCPEDCVKAHWIPLAAPPATKPIGNWAVITLADGTGQWTYKGNPLYTHTLDVVPGDMIGDKFASGNGKNIVLNGGWWRPILRSCDCVQNGA